MANRERIQLWVDALLSGDYEQGYNGLHPDLDSFCCLGVACDLYQRETSKGQWLPGGWFAIEDSMEIAYLPDEVASWLDVGGGVNPIVTYRGSRSLLSTLNDSGLSFQKIAQAIKDTYLIEEETDA